MEITIFTDNTGILNFNVTEILNQYKEIGFNLKYMYMVLLLQKSIFLFLFNYLLFKLCFIFIEILQYNDVIFISFILF